MTVDEVAVLVGGSSYEGVGVGAAVAVAVGAAVGVGVLRVLSC